MKIKWVILLCIGTILLGGCAESNTEDVPGNTPAGITPTETKTPTEAQMPKETQAPTGTPTPTEVVSLDETDLVNVGSYTLSLSAIVPIYEGPSYDYNYMQIVGQDGTYTITEETWDEDGNIWGKLKSGVGWIDLTYVRSMAENKPLITACFADDVLLGNSDYHEHIVDGSEYMMKIAFQAGEPLSNLTFTSLQFGEASYEVAETLYTLDALSPETLFVVGVVFYGDLTTYGISFMDSSNIAHYYFIYISGRNGALILNEYEP